MVSRFRIRSGGGLRSAWPGLAASALWVGACGEAAPQAGTTVTSAGGSASGGALAGGGQVISTGAQGGSAILLPPTGIEITPGCTLMEQGAPVFSDQAVSPGFIRELYSWTTEEQASEIRAGKVLLTRSEREGSGPGYAFEKLQALATMPGETGALAAVLTSEGFAKGRYSWPNPWATRMGWPGETYGNQLLRMVLKPEALLVLFQQVRLSVVDVTNAEVTLADALLQPERLAGFYFIKDSTQGGPFCGSFSGGGNVYREFVVANENMIEEWSLGTETIRQRLLDDIARLETYFARTRACPERSEPVGWNRLVGCQWQAGGTSAFEQGRYEAALSMPSPAYLPAPAQLAALIDTLRADLFEPAPLVIRPGG